MVLRPKVLVCKCAFEKFKKSFAARTCALIAPGVPIFAPHLVRQRNTSKPPQTWFWDLKYWFGSVPLKNSKKSFAARTCALIAPGVPVFAPHLVPQRNTSKPPQTRFWDLKWCFEKFKKKFCGTNLCLNRTWRTRFRTAFSAATKYIQTTSNTVLGPQVVVWKCSFEKFKKKFCGMNFCLNRTWRTRFRTAFSAATKYIQTTS